LLKQEFPGITTLPLKGYNITYTKYKRWLPLKILWQVPKILQSVNRENKWLKKKIKELNIEMVISDNRYGLYTEEIPCVFMTHQLLIKAPFKWLENLIQRINYNYINNYTECWVPDVEGERNMAGLLSHPFIKPSIPIKYVGALCRFKSETTGKTKYDYLFIISGPEPQRTLFERKIFELLTHLKGTAIVIRGRPGENKIPVAAPGCTVKNHVTTSELQSLLNQSEFVISRCGYTTVMEMLSLQKKAILIPTPGQTEQEYLATHLMRQHWCYSCKQKDDLLEHIENARKFQFQFPLIEANRVKPVVEDFFGRKVLKETI
jgi:UDP-N-acetylglucosamine transferase subunit ALG13